MYCSTPEFGGHLLRVDRYHGYELVLPPLVDTVLSPLVVVTAGSHRVAPLKIGIVEVFAIGA